MSDGKDRMLTSGDGSELNPMTWEFCASCGGGGWVGSRTRHEHPGCGHRCTLCAPPPGWDRTYATVPLASGADLIVAERQRQVDAEGWTPEHDASHTGQSLAWAAVCYAAPETVYRRTALARGATYLDPWPWQPDKRVTTGPNAEHRLKGRKPTTAERLRELIKAGALIAAEIDRIQAQS